MANMCGNFKPVNLSIFIAATENPAMLYVHINSFDFSLPNTNVTGLPENNTFILVML